MPPGELPATLASYESNIPTQNPHSGNTPRGFGARQMKAAGPEPEPLRPETAVPAAEQGGAELGLARNELKMKARLPQQRPDSDSPEPGPGRSCSPAEGPKTAAQERNPATSVSRAGEEAHSGFGFSETRSSSASEPPALMLLLLLLPPPLHQLLLWMRAEQ